MKFLHDLLTDDNDYWSLTRCAFFTAFITVTALVVWGRIVGSLSDLLISSYFGLFGIFQVISKGLDRVKPSSSKP